MTVVALLAAITAAIFICLIVSLRFIKPDLDPSKLMISQYAREPRGWIMKLAFYSFAASCVLSAIHLFNTVNDIAGPILLIICAVGTIGCSVFVTDPPDAKDRSINGLIHIISALLVIPVFPFAAILSNVVVSVWLNWLVWLSFVGFTLSVFITICLYKRLVGPTGYLQRIMVISYAIWLVVAATITS